MPHRTASSCAARQRIYKRDGGWIGVTTGARLQFKFAHLSRYWWKFYNAARFELWRVDAAGQAHEAGAHRPEGGLLPARPHAHAAGDAALAPVRALPGVQQQLARCST